MREAEFVPMATYHFLASGFAELRGAVPPLLFFKVRVGWHVCDPGRSCLSNKGKRTHSGRRQQLGGGRGAARTAPSNAPSWTETAASRHLSRPQVRILEAFLPGNCTCTALGRELAATSSCAGTAGCCLARCWHSIHACQSPVLLPGDAAASPNEPHEPESSNKTTTHSNNHPSAPSTCNKATYNETWERQHCWQLAYDRTCVGISLCENAWSSNPYSSCVVAPPMRIRLFSCLGLCTAVRVRPPCMMTQRTTLQRARNVQTRG